jgi:heme oxygenase
MLHGRAERSGFVADMLRGRATRTGYTLFLRNLLPAYQALETGLEKHRQTPGLEGLARPEIYRAKAMEADLLGLCGPDWFDALPLLPAGRKYAHRVAAAAEGSGAGLIGHAYVRYLGDLSGGQVLKRLLSKSLGLAANTLSFYDFPEIDEIKEYKVYFRDVLDQISFSVLSRADVVAAAIEAFSINIQISEAIKLADESRRDGTT